MHTHVNVCLIRRCPCRCSNSNQISRMSHTCTVAYKWPYWVSTRHVTKHGWKSPSHFDYSDIRYISTYWFNYFLWHTFITYSYVASYWFHLNSNGQYMIEYYTVQVDSLAGKSNIWFEDSVSVILLWQNDNAR